MDDIRGAGRILLPIVALALCVAAAAHATASPTPAPAADAVVRDAVADDLVALRNEAIAAYNAQDYARAAKVASRYIEEAAAGRRTGREVAAVSFILGHSRFETHLKEGSPYPGDLRAQVAQPLEESLRVLQDDPAFKNMLLAHVYHELWTGGGRRDPEDEARAHWYLLKSILVRENEVHDRPKDGPEYELFARHLLFYLERCLDLARDSAGAGVYLQRIRSAAPWGFATAYDARFWQIYDLTYFDDGNMRAAAVWQRGLDAMRDPKADPNEVVSIFSRAADLTRSRRDRAEVYRQAADFVSTFDEPERRAQAADFARRAYDLNPGDPAICRQLGSALHVLSYGSYASGRFQQALKEAQDAVGFEWEGMEVAFFDLSRAAAEMGHETEALTHGERAYRMARDRSSGSALQPFAQNYINILRQFGQGGLADRVRQEAAGLGVR